MLGLLPMQRGMSEQSAIRCMTRTVRQAAVISACLVFQSTTSSGASLTGIDCVCQQQSDLLLLPSSPVR